MLCQGLKNNQFVGLLRASLEKQASGSQTLNSNLVAKGLKNDYYQKHFPPESHLFVLVCLVVISLQLALLLFKHLETNISQLLHFSLSASSCDGHFQLNHRVVDDPTCIFAANRYTHIKFTRKFHEVQNSCVIYFWSYYFFRVMKNLSLTMSTQTQCFFKVKFE